jgi:transposase
MNTKKKFTEEFRREAIKLVTEQGYSQSEAGKSLGINGKNISRWLKESQLKKHSPAIQTKQDVNEELNRLRKENHRLKLEREILKKAAAFFANESR